MRNVENKIAALAIEVSVLVYALMALSGCSASARTKEVEVNPENYSSQQIIVQINGYRLELGLPLLEEDSELGGIACRKAKNIYDSGRYYGDHSYIDPQDGSLQPANTLLNPIIGKYHGVYEVLAANVSNPQDLIKAWRGSPGHDQALKLSRATKVGACAVQGPAKPVIAYKKDGTVDPDVAAIGSVEVAIIVEP